MVDPIVGQIGGALASKALDSIGPSGMSDRKAAALSYEYAQRIAQNQIQWRVQDAKAAGIHPLFALGANVSPGSVNVVGGSGNDRSSWSDLGQDLSRSMSAALSSDDRAAAKTATALALEKAGLENDLLRSQIARENNAQVGPGTPGIAGPVIPGQGNSAREVLLPDEVTHSRHGGPYQTAGRAMPATTAFVNADGTVSIWPSRDAKSSIEDSLYEYEHMYRNRILPKLNDLFYDHVYRPTSGFIDSARHARRAGYKALKYVSGRR